MRAAGALALLAVCSCGGCNPSPEVPHDGPPIVVDYLDGSPAIDSRPAPGDDRPPSMEDPVDAEVVWETVLPVDADEPHENYIQGAVALPTGIVAIVPPDLFLVDRTDGHLIATGSLPIGEGGKSADPIAMISRASGDLAILADVGLDRLIAIQYAKEDLSQKSPPVTLEERAPLAGMTESDGTLVVLAGPWAGQSPPELHLHVFDPVDPALRTEVLPYVLGRFEGPGASAPDGTALFCGITYERDAPSYAEIVRINPTTAAVETFRISDEPAKSSACRFAQGGDQLLAVWLTTDADLHWTSISADGTQVLADHVLDAPRWNTTVAYLDDRFAVINGGSGYPYVVVTVSPIDGAVDRYTVPLRPGERSSEYQQAIASDGQNLYTVIAPSPGIGLQHRIQKLAPPPDE